MNPSRDPRWKSLLSIAAALSVAAARAEDRDAPRSGRKDAPAHVLTRHGEVLIGDLAMEVVRVRTSYGLLEVPREEVLRVDFAPRSGEDDVRRFGELWEGLAREETRAAAWEGLLRMGPVVLTLLPTVEVGDDAPRAKDRTNLEQALREALGRRGLHDDLVVARRFRILGAVELESLTVRSSYGPLIARRHDLDRLVFSGAGGFRENTSVVLVRTWTDEDQEFLHTRNAITRHSRTRILDFTGTSAGDLKRALSRSGVLVVPELESGGAAAVAVARGASGSLKKFVREGGVVISCGGQHNAAFLSESGLLACQIRSNDTTGTVRKRHPILRGVRGTVPSINATMPLQVSAGRKMQALVTAPSGEIIVGVSKVGSGAVVYCGWDFYESQEVHQKILANAVEWARSRDAALPW